MKQRNHPSGFTLIELVVAIAIVAILASIAYPSYLDSVRKGRRTDAMSALLKVQLDEERWRASNSAYTTDLTDLGWSSNPSTSPDGYYTIATTAADATTFTATATTTTKNGQNGDTYCSVFAINQDGPDLTNTTNDSCWAR